MAKNLVIVESPAKAKTIEGYLGKDFKVSSSYGHIRDLPKNNQAIDIENGFKPTYEISPDKKDVIRNLKKLVKTSEQVYLASDDDREGEAISWHLKHALNLKDEITKRIVFREITKKAILKSLENPRDIDQNLVNAQQARRVLDRLVGFELSPILWKKIKTGLSAGRVQSVAVRLVVEREREIDAFEAESFFKVVAQFDLEGGKVLEAELNKKFKTDKEALEFLEACKKGEFKIENLETKPGKKSPAPPFTTSQLQQEASRKLGFPVSMTMRMAQKLYEAGKITYMRTDSVNLSDDAIAGAAAAIKKSYGAEYAQSRRYKTKSSGAQEAHEAIRPTDFGKQTAGGSDAEKKLYGLIWRRAIASQMADAQLEKTTAKISIKSGPEAKTPGEIREEIFVARGEVVKFEGFLKVYSISKDEDEEDEENKNMLPPLKEGQILDLDHISARERFSRPPARYTEATLVKTLEEKGIGRPSTYAPTISTIQRREYVVKEGRDGTEREYKELVLATKKYEKSKISEPTIFTEEKTEITGTEKNKLFPTNVGMVVNDFLVEHFADVVDYSFTANVEEEFDEIAEGKKVWNKMIAEFYKKFHPKVKETEEIDRSEVPSSRELGTDPKTGKTVIARLGRYGPLVQIGEANEETGEKPKFASLLKGQFIDTISLEEALELFKLPRTVGEFEGKEVTAAIGRFGPYIRHDNKFVSIPKEEDPLKIKIDKAIELIEAKRKADAEKFIKDFPENPDVQVLNGRWGPYIKVGKKNVKIPKDKDPKELTLEECLELAEKAPERKGRRGGRKTAKKKTTKK